MNAQNIHLEQLKDFVDYLQNENSNLASQLEQRPTFSPPDYHDFQSEFQELRNRPTDVATEFPVGYEFTKLELDELKKYLANWKDDPINQRPINNDSIIAKPKQMAL